MVENCSIESFFEINFQHITILTTQFIAMFHLLYPFAFDILSEQKSALEKLPFYPFIMSPFREMT